MNECIFCKIVRGEIPSTKVYEDDETYAFMDINPVNPGHTLVIPKKHAIDIFEIDEDSWKSVMHTARKVAHAQEKALAPDGVNIAMNNRAGAGQVVFHAHVHVIPRFSKDGYQMWKGGDYTEGEATHIASRISSSIE